MNFPKWAKKMCRTEDGVCTLHGSLRRSERKKGREREKGCAKLEWLLGMSSRHLQVYTLETGWMVTSHAFYCSTLLSSIYTLCNIHRWMEIIHDEKGERKKQRHNTKQQRNFLFHFMHCVGVCIRCAKPKQVVYCRWYGSSLVYEARLFISAASSYARATRRRTEPAEVQWTNKTDSEN